MKSAMTIQSVKSTNIRIYYAKTPQFDRSGGIAALEIDF